MEIAYSTLLIVLFLLPGSIFINTIFSDPNGKLTFDSPFEFIYRSLLPSILFHSLTILAITQFVNFPFELEYFKYLFENNFDRYSLNQILYGILIYLLFVLLLSRLVAVLLRTLIFKFRLDLRFNYLRFRNEFFYVIYGNNELYGFNRNKRLIATMVTLELKSAPNQIFKGLLTNYSYSKDGLNYIIIKNAVKSSSKEINLTPMDSDKTYFDFQNIQNISFSNLYVEIEKKDEKVNEEKTVPNNV